MTPSGVGPRAHNRSLPTDSGGGVLADERALPERNELTFVPQRVMPRRRKRCSNGGGASPSLWLFWARSPASGAAPVTPYEARLPVARGCPTCRRGHRLAPPGTSVSLRAVRRSGARLHYGGVLATQHAKR